MASRRGILRAGVRVGASRPRVGISLLGEERPPKGEPKRTGLPGGGLCTEARKRLGCEGKMDVIDSESASLTRSSSGFIGEPGGVIVDWIDEYNCASMSVDPGDNDPRSLYTESSYS